MFCLFSFVCLLVFVCLFAYLLFCVWNLNYQKHSRPKRTSDKGPVMFAKLLVLSSPGIYLYVVNNL